MRICDLRQKEVINIKDCKRLGYVCDIEFDRKTGCITHLIVPGTGKIWQIYSDEIQHRSILQEVCQIGPDIILVDIDEEKNQSEIKKNN